LAAGDCAVLAEETNVETLLGSSNGSAPACVVVAADQPDRAAVDTARLIRAKFQDTATVLICRNARGPELRRALERGVDGVVLRRDAEEALVAVIAAVCVGQVSLPSGHRGEIMVPALTTREKQILAHATAGRTNAEIADRLFLAESTVKSHLSSAFSKLGVSSRYEAAALVLDPERGRKLGFARFDSANWTENSTGVTPKR
jgi:two-component system response regulator DesR